jgi:transposase-like protein
MVDLSKVDVSDLLGSGRAQADAIRAAAREIKRAVKAHGGCIRETAVYFGVHRSTLERWIDRAGLREELWPLRKRANLRQPRGRKKLTIPTADELQRVLRESATRADAAAVFGVTVPTLYTWIRTMGLKRKFVRPKKKSLPARGQ